MYWLPKLHKRPYKARFITNSSTTTELSKLLTSCRIVVKSQVTSYERSRKNVLVYKNSGEVHSLLKSIEFRAIIARNHPPIMNVHMEES